MGSCSSPVSMPLVAGSAGGAGSASSAGSAGSAGTAGSAGSAGTAGSAGSVGSAGSAGSAGTPSGTLGLDANSCNSSCCLPVIIFFILCTARGIFFCPLPGLT